MPQRLWTRAETRRFLRAENPHQQQQQQLEQQRSNNKVQAAAQAGDRHSSSFSFSSVSRSISIASSTFAAVATVAANWSYPPRSPCNMPQHNATQRNAVSAQRQSTKPKTARAISVADCGCGRSSRQTCAHIPQRYTKQIRSPSTHTHMHTRTRSRSNNASTCFRAAACCLLLLPSLLRAQPASLLAAS